jgi:curved DNA-binding protein CbpA
MNDLHKAYAVLGLEPGSSLDSIMRRYKRLIMVWHPDRAPSPEHKEFAEEELKKINNAKDILNKHFGSGGGHKASECECQPDQEAGSSTKSSPGGSSRGPNYQRTKNTDEKFREEQAAKKRDAERRAHEEQEATAKRAQEQQQKATQQAMQDAVQQQKTLSDEKLRWQISIGIIIAFIGLEVFGSMAIGVKHWWHDFTWKWQNEHSTSITPSDTNTNTGSSTSTNTDTTSGSAAYVPPYYQTPGGNPTSWQQEQEQRDKEQKDRDQKQHDQDVYFTKLEIDKWQKSIEHSTTTIADLEAQIANPSVSDYEKQKLQGYQDYQRKCLSDAQASLKAAQDKLTGLTGEVTPPSVSSLLTPMPSLSTPLKPSLYNSPAAPPADSAQAPPSNSINTLPSLRSRLGLDSPSSPISSSPSFSELMKKYSLNSQTDNDSPPASTQTNSFFGKDSPLTTTPSSSRFSDLLKRFETKPVSPTDTSSPSN